MTAPAKALVKRVYPNAKDARCVHPKIYDGYIEIWSDGVKEGVLLAHGRTRREAWEKAAAKIPRPA